MTGAVGTLMLLAALMGVFAILFRGVLPKHRGRGAGGILTRLTSPSDAPIAAAALCALTLAAGMSRVDRLADSTSAIAVGVLLGALVAIPACQHLTIAACGVVGFVIALIDAGRFILGASEFGYLTPVFRVSLMLLVLACFWLAVVIFDRHSALRGERGLALFGLVEIATFLAAPTGRDIIGFGHVSATAYVIAACVLAFIVGFAVSEYLLGLIALALVVTVWFGNAVFGDIDNGDPRAAWLGFVAAVFAGVVVLVISAGFRRLGVR